jgi:hypothetical protein
MSFVRIAFEHLFLLLFRVVRSACFAQGLAIGTAALAATLLPHRPERAPWLEDAVRTGALIAAIFFATGLLLPLARFLAPTPIGVEKAERAPGMDGGAGGWGWLLLLGLSLAVVPLVAFEASSDLVALWREILDLLDRAGFWRELQRANGFSGIVLMPVLAALCVPALEAVAAFFLIALPPGLLVLFATRSRRFPEIFARTATVQAALVLASLLAADLFSRLVAQATPSMIASGDTEVRLIAEELHRAQGVLTSTARAFLGPLLGTLGWLPLLFRSRRAGAIFTTGPVATAIPSPRIASPAQAELAVEKPATGAEIRAWHRRLRDRKSPPELSRPPQRFARVAFLSLGSLLLVFAGCESLLPRARYASSQPAPLSVLAVPPAAVVVAFSDPLDARSSLSVSRTITRSPSGEETFDSGTAIATSSGLDPGDPERRTLRADLPAGIPGGLYWVSWRSVPLRGGIERYGSFSFGAGMPVPESIVRDARSVDGRDVGERQRRSTLAAGTLLLALGGFLPWLPRRL